MRPTDEHARALLVDHDHGILCTVHRERGVDAVPAVYAVDGAFVGGPGDRVKPQASFRLQRERNLERDPRATLLVENWDRLDWSKLWWVRAELRWEPGEAGGRAAALSARLATRFAQYHDEPFERVLVMRVLAITGWAAGSS
ncbi:MAG: TIGR03668 family PPOX class F420-dependent oxidoreductase [Acidimicrobiales bacterium]